MNMDPKSSADETNPANESIAIPVIEESVTVYKNVVDNGGLRIRKIVHGETVEVDEPLETQGVNCVRVPIGREVDGPVSIRYEAGATIIPIVEERLVVRRQLVLVEEVHISRDSFTRRVPQSVTVRREELVIERQAPGEREWRVEEPDDTAGSLNRDDTVSN
jgi:uncharacterized protein (TIGR02271 family)